MREFKIKNRKVHENYGDGKWHESMCESKDCRNSASVIMKNNEAAICGSCYKKMHKTNNQEKAIKSKV